MKIKYIDGLVKLIASRIAGKNKRSFAKFVNNDLSSFAYNICNRSIHINIISFSSSNDFYDQILSILSFLRYVGEPSSWTIYSDGSHTADQIELIESSFTFARIIVTDWEIFYNKRISDNTPISLYKESLVNYARQHALGKRLFLYLTHDIQSPTLFLDADVLFYPQATIITSILEEQVNGWYLPDAEWGCLDVRYKELNTRQLYQVNGGLLLINKNLINLSAGLEFLNSLNNVYDYFSEQTVMHILAKANGFLPLDPRIFILNSGDQFDLSYLMRRDQMAIRHYTGPVRHKMWQRDWNWQLSLT